MEFTHYSRTGFFAALLGGAALIFSSCEKNAAPNDRVDSSQVESVDEEMDDSMPLIVHPVCLVAGEGGDEVFTAMLSRMLIKLTDSRADLELTSIDEARNGIIVALGEISDDLHRGIAAENLAVVRVGDRYASDPRVVAAIGVDSVFAAGQFGEAVRAVAVDKGKVLICPVPESNLTAAEKLVEFESYLARVAPRTPDNGYALVTANAAMPDEEACESWLASAITPTIRDKELAVIVGMTRQATHNGLMRLRAIGLSETVPLVGYGIDRAMVQAMDAGELEGVFLMDPGTLESALRVALDKAAKALETKTEVVEEKDPLLVPLRWVSFETLTTDEGRTLVAPYLESE